MLWCNVHQRKAWLCSVRGGITLPCRVVDLTGQVELENEVKATIQLTGAEPFEVEITDQALDDIRFKFNPSNLDNVTKLKTVAATYLSLLEKLSAENPVASREFDMTRTLFQFVSLGGVLAATKGL